MGQTDTILFFVTSHHLIWNKATTLRISRFVTDFVTCLCYWIWVQYFIIFFKNWSIIDYWNVYNTKFPRMSKVYIDFQPMKLGSAVLTGLKFISRWANLLLPKLVTWIIFTVLRYNKGDIRVDFMIQHVLVTLCQGFAALPVARHSAKTLYIT